mgnify:CR=1 FL=1
MPKPMYCSKCGDIYDGELNAVCPNCSGGGVRKDNDHAQSGGSMPPTSGGRKPSIQEIFSRKGGKTMSIEEIANMQRGGNMDPTVIKVKKKLGFDPVVGWLVCVKGNDIGKDFRLHSGNNFVGRGDESDVRLSDPSVSRDKHFIVTYDHRGNSYFISCGSGREEVYVNNQILIGGAMQLKRGDIIIVADTVLIFIPFGSDDFQWEWGGQ